MISARSIRTLLASGLTGPVLAALASASASHAMTLDGLHVPAVVQLQPENVELAVQGGYVRTYFFRRTTSYALYVAEPARTFEQLVASPSPKRMVVTVLMPEFTQEQFRSGWRGQFAAALSPEQLRVHAHRIEQFLAAFETLRRGEQVIFDFVPGGGGAHRASRRTARSDHRRCLCRRAAFRVARPAQHRTRAGARNVPWIVSGNVRRQTHLEQASLDSGDGAAIAAAD